MSSIALYDVLLALGAEKGQARAAADDVADPVQLATKTDLAEVKIDIIKWLVGVNLVAAGLIVGVVALII